MDYRVILYHKQATSARTRFLKYAYNSVCAFEPIPMPAQQLEGDHCCDTPNHPAAILRQVEQRLSLPAGCLKAEGEYRHSVEAPGKSIQIFLACITTIDPPFEEAERAGAEFIDLTQARGLPGMELELLRHAYELVLGG
ncbi:MAG: hypothetical protein P8166_12930 [Candidatus Thiodiazotropha sp.]|jgi:hypothetical protein